MTRSPLMLAASLGILAAVNCTAEPEQRADSSISTPIPSADSALTVTEFGIGPLRAGMTIAEATAALSGALTIGPGTDSTGCGYLTWQSGPPGVRVMIDGGTVARVEVDSIGVATEAGARVGDSQARVEELYRGRVTVGPHKYTNGHYLTVTPANPADSVYRIIFETDSGRVVRYRAGRRPAVEYVERCG